MNNDAQTSLILGMKAMQNTLITLLYTCPRRLRSGLAASNTALMFSISLSRVLSHAMEMMSCNFFFFLKKIVVQKWEVSELYNIYAYIN